MHCPNWSREIWSADSAKAPSSGAADFFPGLYVCACARARAYVRACERVHCAPSRATLNQRQVTLIELGLDPYCVLMRSRHAGAGTARTHAGRSLADRSWRMRTRTPMYLSGLMEGWSDEWLRMGTPSRSDTYTPLSPRTCASASMVTVLPHTLRLSSRRRRPPPLQRTRMQPRRRARATRSGGPHLRRNGGERVLHVLRR